MREIKFRAWLKDKQVMKKIRSIEWAGIEVSSGFIKHIDTVNDRYYSKDYNDKGNYILMQYTGLKDANGLTEIYEGDIIDENGLVKGNIYEITEMDKRETDTVIQGFGTKDWCETYRRAILCGCKDSE